MDSLVGHEIGYEVLTIGEALQIWGCGGAIICDGDSKTLAIKGGIR